MSKLEAKKRSSCVRKKVTAHKLFAPPVFTHLSWHGAVYPGSCFSVQHELKYSVSCKTEPSKVSGYTKFYVPNFDSFKKDWNKKLFAKADSSVDKVFSCPSINLSNSQTLILDDVETGVLLSDFAQQRRRENADVPDFYFILLDTAGLSPTLNQNAKVKQRGSRVSFKKRTSEAAKGGAAYGSVRNLKKASNLPVSKMRQFLHSKASYTKLILAMR